jgi:DNA-binding NtrC family response regulator
VRTTWAALLKSAAGIDARLQEQRSGSARGLRRESSMEGRHADGHKRVPAANLDAATVELHLEDLERHARGDCGAPLPLKDWVALAEAWRIAQALREARGNRSAAARALGIGRRTLYSKMEKLGFVPSWGVPLDGRFRSTLPND